VTDAGKRFKAPAALNDWELGWYITAADLLDRKEQAEEARQERSRRKAGIVPRNNEARGLLPLLAA